MSGRSLGHRAPVLWIVIPLMLGLCAGKCVEAVWIPGCLAMASVLAIGAVVLGFRNSRGFEAILCLTLFFAGAASYAHHRARLTIWDSLPPREATLRLRIDRIFAQNDLRKVTGLATIVRSADPLADLIGQRITFSLTMARGTPAPIRSSVISAIGLVVTLPRNPAPTTFDGYLANRGINFRLTRGRVLAEVSPASAYYRFCARQASHFTDIFGWGVVKKRPDLVGILRAMMLGQRNELTDEQITNFRQTGTMHVFSISGLHIVVIATGVHALLSLLRAPRQLRYAIGLAALWLYVDITGAAPSAIRAFVMVAVIETALAFRLPRNPLSALATSALIILIFDPLQLFSASFQMSYGIVAALLLLGLPLADAWQQQLALFQHLPPVSWGWRRRLIDAGWRGLLTASAIGTAASLVSALTGILYFNLLTPGAFFANLWLIPASTAVIYMGTLSLLFGLVHFTPAAVLGNHAALLVLDVIEWAVHVTVKIPSMWFGAQFRSEWIGPIALGVLLAMIIFGYARKWEGLHRGYWIPFAWVLAVLLFGVTYGLPAIRP
ncbi:MAG: ComEC/Rec2 family competence protein [Opitutus sp.]